MSKYYFLAVVGGLFAAAADSYVLLGLTISVTLLLYVREKVNEDRNSKSQSS